MLVVAGVSLKNFHPRVWDPTSPYYLPDLSAVMVSYAEFHQLPRQRERAMEVGLHRFLGCSTGVKIFLDNGSFYFLKRDGCTDHSDYIEFVRRAHPDWFPIPQDFIPSPSMSLEEQLVCWERTMVNNERFGDDGFVPVMHISRVIDDYVAALRRLPGITNQPAIALGGIVPNLLRAPKAMPYREVLSHVRRTRDVFQDKRLHLFGVGGTATLHIAALLGMDSVDSSGWRNRAARGLVQLPGSGDRLVAELGSWRGRVPDAGEWDRLANCTCPACRASGIAGLRANRRIGFEHRATHNLWVLLQENASIQSRLTNGSYADWYAHHLDNTIYAPLIQELVTQIR